MPALRMVAVDLGANSGRVAAGHFDGRYLKVEEAARFPNIAVRAHDRLYWDPLRLFAGLLEGCRKAAGLRSERVASVGVDGWGVDFALLDKAGRLVQNPVHYRDARTQSAFAEVCEMVPPVQIFKATGNQLMAINTLYQLWSMRASEDPALDIAADLLMIPDLFNYWLSGLAVREWTEATTTQCYDPVARGWAWPLLNRLGLPAHLFKDTVPSGTVLGPLRAEVMAETGFGGHGGRPTSVVATASHDTASAIAAIPFRQHPTAYVSSGTWSVVGMEVPGPVLDDRAFNANLTNEGGPERSWQLMSNLTGLWVVQECQRAWALSGKGWGFDELAALAASAPAFGALVDPNAPAFVAPGDMPARIGRWCRAAGQPVPDGPGPVVRALLEGLAMSYRRTVDEVGAAAGRPAVAVHIVGGGSQDPLLCQWTADATGLPVWAGPTEATELGNLLAQAMALGELGSLDDARAVVGESFPPVLYEPGRRDAWDEAFERFLGLPAVPPA